MQNCDSLLALLRERMQDRMSVRQLDGKTCLLRTPFLDHEGDPIVLTVTSEAGVFSLDDAGIIAGSLFSLGQHPVDTPAFRLVDSLAKAYGLQIDFNEGLVKMVVRPDDLSEGIMELAKVIITVVTAVPHIRVSPHRLRLFGQRCRTKIRRHFQQSNVLDLVEPDHELRGAVEVWPVDFHWSIRTDGRERQVYVVAVDLDLVEPLRKAERIAALAVDTRSFIQENLLRVVMDKHGQNSQSDVAAAFLKEHSHSLGFRTFDFGLEEEQRSFIDNSVDELLGEAGQAWRLFFRR